MKNNLEPKKQMIELDHLSMLRSTSVKYYLVFAPVENSFCLKNVIMVFMIIITFG